MATRGVGLRDVSEGHVSRLRLLAPLRYLAIRHAEKTSYDVIAPIGVAVVACIVYFSIEPKPAIFGENGLLRFTRDLLIMAVPFMIGALAAVSMGSPGAHLDRRPVGTDLLLDGEILTLRQFVCYLLGYLSFLGLLSLIAVVGATLLHDAIVSLIVGHARSIVAVRAMGVFSLALLLSSLSITVFWSLYFLTEVVNRKS